MIVRMKKVALICLLEHREEALHALRKLGVLHVESGSLAESDDRAAIERQMQEVARARTILSAREPSTDETTSTAEPQNSPEQLVEEANLLDKQLKDIASYRQGLLHARELLEPWGDFSPELLDQLRCDGISVLLCEGTETDIDKVPEDAGFKIIGKDGNKVCFAVFADRHLDDAGLPVARLPEGLSLHDVDTNIAGADEKLREIGARLDAMSAANAKVENLLASLGHRLEFAICRDGMIAEGVLACIRGYCPVPLAASLSKAAEAHGWGLMLDDPSDRDTPPTFIKTPKLIESSKAIFDFIGITPGYREWDISASFLFFFTLFFGMIFGDAGYGAIFLALAVFAKLKFGKRRSLRLSLNLFLLLSTATLFWGVVTGNYFAIPAENLPSWMRGLEWFTDPVLKDKHIQLLCFGIAAVHLSFARFWKASLVLNSTRALGEIGWGLVLWANFFVARKLIVYPESEWPLTLISAFYGVGIVFVVVFGVDWKKLDEAFGFLFGLSGSFVDLLSYIRLFAVGLSSYYIAKSFNDMGLMILGVSSNALLTPLLVLAMVVVILFGHVLNVLLGMLGVLVHGIRLNTLEFSNHMGLQWLGHLYSPFRDEDAAAGNGA
ncbi:MAG: hypothetical protein JW808_03360 [Victivallales bacterium]|nr:hypothetical protein [Victivallales bacterium]